MILFTVHLVLKTPINKNLPCFEPFMNKCIAF